MRAIPPPAIRCWSLLRQNCLRINQHLSAPTGKDNMLQQQTEKKKCMKKATNQQRINKAANKYSFFKL